MTTRIGLSIAALLWCLCASVHAQPICTVEQASDTTRLGCSDTGMDSIVIVNTGDAPLIISSFSFATSVNGVFSSCTNPLPILQPTERASLRVCMTLPSAGVATCTAVIGSNSLNDPNARTMVPLAARRDLLSVALSRDTIDFGTLSACGSASDTLTIINDGTLVVGAPAASTRNGFRWEPENSNNIAPGERRVVTISFVGNITGSPYNTLGTFGFSGSGCFVLKEFWMKAVVAAAPCLVVRVGSVSCRAGDRVLIPITQDSVAESVDLTGSTMNVEFTYDPTVLVPDGSVPAEISRKLGSIFLNIPLRKGSGQLLSLPFRATLGMSATSPLNIRSYSFVPAPLLVSVENGTATLTDVCIDPRPRYFDPLVRIPTITSVRVHGGRVELDLSDAAPHNVSAYSIMGACVASTTSVDGHAAFPALPTGLYVIRCADADRPFLLQVHE